MDVVRRSTICLVLWVSVFWPLSLGATVLHTDGPEKYIVPGFSSCCYRAFELEVDRDFRQSLFRRVEHVEISNATVHDKHFVHSFRRFNPFHTHNCFSSEKALRGSNHTTTYVSRVIILTDGIAVVDNLAIYASLNHNCWGSSSVGPFRRYLKTFFDDSARCSYVARPSKDERIERNPRALDVTGSLSSFCGLSSNRERSGCSSCVFPASDNVIGPLGLSSFPKFVSRPPKGKSKDGQSKTGKNEKAVVVAKAASNAQPDPGVIFDKQAYIVVNGFIVIVMFVVVKAVVKHLRARKSANDKRSRHR